MVCEPARPSPIAAPMAPPPRARPPPTSAPAVPIADSNVCAMCGSPLLLVSRSVVGGRGHPEVHDREEREDQRLDRPDEQPEGLPDEPREERQRAAARGPEQLAADDR